VRNRLVVYLLQLELVQSCPCFMLFMLVSLFSLCIVFILCNYHDSQVRAGTQDDITRDRSTFFAEMASVSQLCALLPGQRVLVALDELGRSTSPSVRKTE
jgi:hypothetical protein